MRILDIAKVQLTEGIINATILKDLMREVQRISDMWGQAGDHDAEYSYEEVDMEAERLEDMILHLIKALDTEPQMKSHPMVQGLLLNALKTGVIGKEQIPSDVNLSESASMGATGAGSIASAPAAMGGMASRASIYGKQPKRRKKSAKKDK